MAPTSAAPTLELVQLRIHVTGISPLLLHNPANTMTAPTAGARRGSKEVPASAEEAENCLYRLPTGDFGMPNAALRSAIITAAEMLKLKLGSGKRTDPSVASMLYGALQPDPEIELISNGLVRLEHPQSGKPLKTYEVDARRAVLPNGSGVVRSRPRFAAWAATFGVSFDSAIAALLDEHLTLLLRTAGLSVGLGDFRPYVRKPTAKTKPSFGGPFGRFTAVVAD